VTLTDHNDGTATLNISPDDSHIGNHSLDIVVTDENNNYDSEMINISVHDSGQGNIEPILSPIGSQAVTAGNVKHVNLSATDADGDEISYSITPDLGFVSLTDNGDGTGSLTIAPGSSDIGTHSLDIIVTDTQNSYDSEMINIIVGSYGNSDPVLTPVGNQRVDEGGILNITLSASDADRDALHFSISPDDLGFISLRDNHDGTGLLTIAPQNGDAGIYNLVIIVSDEYQGRYSETIEIIVDKIENGNYIPVINPVEDQIVIIGEVRNVFLSASDADGDPIRYSFNPELSFVSLFDNEDGTAILRISPETGNVGKYNVTINVSDLNGGISSEIFSIIVNNSTSFTNSNFINSGGSSLSYGSMFAQEDKYFNGGKTASRPPSYRIEGTENDEIYRSVRYGNFSYDIPVPSNGLYTVRLHFAEVTFTDGTLGKRVFDVDIEDGQETLLNYDINADVGPMKAVIKTFTGIKVNDEKLTIELKTVVQNALLSGIEFINETDKLTSLEDLEEQNNFLIYPNPSNGIFTVELSEDHHQLHEIPIVIYDIAGKIVFESTFQGPKDVIDLSGKRKGMYILRSGDFNTEKVFIQ
jgi:hypothetical protein